MLLRVVLFSFFFSSSFVTLRLVSSMDALANGATTGEVGVLMALVTFFPIFLSMRCGRWVDGAGFKLPFVISAVFLLLSGLIPALLLTGQWGFIPLGVSCVLNGLANMVLAIASLYLLGAIAPKDKRTAWFSWFSLNWSLSGLIPPIVAGYIIDLCGHRWAYVMTVLCTIIGYLLFLDTYRYLKDVTVNRSARPAKSRGGSLGLFFDKNLAPVLFTSTVIAIGWDLQMFMFPVYGHAIGFTATQVGWLVGGFFAGTLAIRFVLPMILHFIREWLCIALALVVITLGYAIFPRFTEFMPLLVTAFWIGIGLGGANPNILSLMQTNAPKGRVGEALGVRTMLCNGAHFVLPMAYGSILAAISIAVLFYICAGVMGLTALVAFKNVKHDKDVPLQ